MNVIECPGRRRPPALKPWRLSARSAAREFGAKEETALQPKPEHANDLAPDYQGDGEHRAVGRALAHRPAVGLRARPAVIEDVGRRVNG